MTFAATKESGPELILRKTDGKKSLRRQNNISEIIERTGRKLGVVLFELGALTPHNLDRY